MLNLRWSWHPPTVELFESIDPAGWAASGGDPVAMLSSIRPGQLGALAADEGFLRRLEAAVTDLRGYTSQPRWYQSARVGETSAGETSAGETSAGETRVGETRVGETRVGENGAGAAESLPKAIAYFSPEYGITAVLPQYSGGLGILAGDHLKSASDLGVPIIGVGLLYRHGYFTQSLSADGWQAERYPADDPNGLPLTLLRQPARPLAEGATVPGAQPGDLPGERPPVPAAEAGDPVKITVPFPDGKLLTAQVWLAQVGRVPLLMLDSYVEENEPAQHEVTDRLYGGGSEHRLRQELLLGIGGVRAVRAFCAITGHAEPEVFHTNEGHAGFLGIERIREYVATGLSFDEALELSRAGTVFTTHTPVPAGIDRFPRELIGRYFTADGAGAGLPVDRVLALGAETYPGGDPHMFNMAVMGMRLAQRVNGVSVLHGQVSREMFAGLWPGFDTAEVPIGSITNGVHAPTWVAREVSDLGDSERAAASSAPRLWEIRRQLRARLVAETRRRLRESWQQRGASGAELTWIDDVLDEDVLTIGFARRVPSYKRLTLMLNDPQRLAGLLLDADRPIQIVIAGKAHPADESGKRLIQQMVRFADSEGVRRRIVFLPDYDMAMARFLVQGCDVWLNNPLRPLEACGTSGMKVALNGGLNLSVRDGWWDEWYDGGNGWEIPTADGVEDPSRRDELEAAALYELIAKSVAPLFYDLGADGVPEGWVEMLRHGLRSLGPLVQADRMVADYVTRLYAPAALASRALASDASGTARDLATWKARVRQAWSGVRVEHVEADGAEPALGAVLDVRVTTSLGDLSANDVCVEVVYGRLGDDDELVDPSYVTLAPDDSGQAPHTRFSGSVELGQPGPFGYTVRVLPSHPLLASRADLGLVAYPEGPAGMSTGDLR
jgi:glycogen phosphorylase